MVIIGLQYTPCRPVPVERASMAMEDGLELVRCLRDISYVPAALIAYERLRREHVERCAGPPIYFRSTTAVRFPSLAIVQAIILPAVTLPTTGTANFFLYSCE